MLKGCRTVLKELQGLDFPQAEVRLYFQAANKLPKGFGGQTADMARARTALDLLLKVDEEGDPLPARRFPDLPGLLLTQAVLSDLWRWRRKGGGMDYTESEQRPHQAALEDIQEFKPEDMDRIQSSLLDNLPISDKDKAAMSGTMQQAAVGAFNGAVWGSLVASLAFLAYFNFFRGG